MRPHILYRTISVTHLSAYLIHLKKVAIFDTNLISIGCVCAHTRNVQGRIQDFGKGGSDKYIHNWGRVREGVCPLP